MDRSKCIETVLQYRLVTQIHNDVYLNSAGISLH